ncbi:MAG: cupin domain-containing protein [Pseudomonadales bacterium]|nr:cupin domain-containing protein [Pseudomonadales bacterium]
MSQITEPNKSVLSAEDIAELPERRNVHQFNAKAIRHTKSIGDLAGLTTIGIHLVRVEPGDETTQHHNHEVSDEFVYILQGEGTLFLGDESMIIKAGDFAGFPKNGEAHSMKNTGDEDLVYLMGGGRPEFDICNYPKINRRMYLVNGDKEFVDLEHLGKI